MIIWVRILRDSGFESSERGVVEFENDLFEKFRKLKRQKGSLFLLNDM
jgi:hypothetical protein